MPVDEFNQYCESLLAQQNKRNRRAMTRHIMGLCDILRQEGDHALQTKFGGSVSRGTEVNGLSDVDVLLVVNQSSLSNMPPRDVISYIDETIKKRFPTNPVRVGALAVTVNYSDGSEIQILPALRTRDGVRIADPGSVRWSKVVRPDKFAQKLVEVNGACNGRVVLAIRLAKVIADCFIKRPSRKITGYHMESLAIEAFEGYRGPLDPKSMLIHLFGNSIRAVLTPLVDSSGQSRFVDDSLGPASSKSRRRASTYFGQM